VIAIVAGEPADEREPVVRAQLVEAAAGVGRVEPVVVGQPHEVLAPCVLEHPAVVAGMPEIARLPREADARVLGGEPLADPRDLAVRARVVRDNDFDVVDVLGEGRPYSALELAGTVVGGDADAQQRRHPAARAGTPGPRRQRWLKNCGCTGSVRRATRCHGAGST
jgi:hypothetical protein